MADNFPNQVKPGTQTVEVDAALFDIQAQHQHVIADDEIVFGSRAAVPFIASVGSSVSAASQAGYASRPSQPSVGATASIALAGSIASEPALNSSGSITSIASVADYASKAALSPSAGSVASVAADASAYATGAGRLSLSLRAKQQRVHVKRPGTSIAGIIEILPEGGKPIDDVNKLILYNANASARIIKHNGNYFIT